MNLSVRDLLLYFPLLWLFLVSDFSLFVGFSYSKSHEDPLDHSSISYAGESFKPLSEAHLPTPGEPYEAQFPPLADK